MSFERIENFLLEYRQRLFEHEDKRAVCMRIIKDISGISISEKELLIRRGVLSIKGHTVIQNELFLYKEKILEEFARNKLPVTDIR